MKRSFVIWTTIFSLSRPLDEPGVTQFRVRTRF